ncbi:MAG: DUF1295 domain-containing protein [Candidatus Saccharibacteria bacterium]
MRKELVAGFLFLVYVVATMITQFQAGIYEQIMPKFILVSVAVIVYITIIFVISQIIKRLDVIDIAWGGGFIVAALTSFSLNSRQLEIGWNIQTLTTTLVLIWGLRLAYHILRRIMSHDEDPRYVELGKRWKGNLALNAYVRIFLIQGILATLISIAVIHINLSAPGDISWVTWLGVFVWIIGFCFESIGDAQLKKHLANPKNKGNLMASGLWKYTRHPNYFGEATQWWGIFIIALATPFGWIAIITPAMITYLLLFVSGVPLTEQRFEGRTGWTNYKKRTSMFIPMPTRKP